MQMTTEPHQPYAYDTAGGTVRVQILASHLVESTVDGRKVIEYDHLVQVTTDEVTGAGHEDGYVKVRGRRYRIDRVHRRERRPWVSPFGQLVRWSLFHIPYGGGFRNEKDGDVRSAKACEALRQIELEVLERFEAEVPDWPKVSERMCDSNERQRWHDIAATRRTALADAEQRIAYFTARISA